jgi:hypothetical protein
VSLSRIAFQCAVQASVWIPLCCTICCRPAPGLAAGCSAGSRVCLCEERGCHIHNGGVDHTSMGLLLLAVSGGWCDSRKRPTTCNPCCRCIDIPRVPLCTTCYGALAKLAAADSLGVHRTAVLPQSPAGRLPHATAMISVLLVRRSVLHGDAQISSAWRRVASAIAAGANVRRVVSFFRPTSRNITP